MWRNALKANGHGSGQSRENDPLISVEGNLEQRAREIVKRSQMQNGHASPAGTVERDLALVVHHLDRHRALWQGLHRNLLDQERYVNAIIRARKPRGPGYNGETSPILDPLRHELQGIEHERRRLSLIAERERRELFDRLATLLNRHAALSY